MSDTTTTHPDTPDGRYFVVRGRLWRKSDPRLTEDRRANLVRELMRARNDLCQARRRGDDRLRRDARDRIQRTKEELGERGPVWWADGAPDYTRKLAVNTPYRAWYEGVAVGVGLRSDGRHTNSLIGSAPSTPTNFWSSPP